MPSGLEWLPTQCRVLQEFLTRRIPGVNHCVRVGPLLKKRKLFVGEAQHLPELFVAQLNQFLDPFLPVRCRDIRVQYDLDLFRVRCGLNIFESRHNVLTDRADIIGTGELV